MNFLLIPIGSAGDVHPFVALGLELKRRGHRVTLFTNGHFEPLARRVGLDFLELGTEEDFQAAIDHPDLWHSTRGFRIIAELAMMRPMRRVYEVIAERFVPGETVVAAQVTAFGARLAREKLGVPLATINLQPAMLRSVHVAPVLPTLPMPEGMPKAIKRWIYRLCDALVLDPLLGPGLNAYRTELGLPPVRRVLDDWWWSPDLVLNLFPGWYAPPQPDWPPQTRMTGFPLFDGGEAETMPRELSAFLDAGEPPIAFTPGSAMKHGRGFFEAAAEACRRLGRRGLLLTRFAEQVPDPLPDGVRHVDYAPFGQLLRRVEALVHHGGIGTTAQGLAAGLPHLVMPLSHDQPDNAVRLIRLGVGRALTPRAFRGAAVTRALRALIGSRAVADRCREVAARFVGVDSIGEACGALERLAEESPVPVR